MNEFSARIRHVQQQDSLAFIELDVVNGGDVCCCMVILSDLEAEEYYPGREVTMVFKESAVAIAKGPIPEISVRNRFGGTISKIKAGKILTQVFVDCNGNEISAFIPACSAREMRLREGDAVMALVKAGEVGLSWET